jgi:hypothetical protein
MSHKKNPRQRLDSSDISSYDENDENENCIDALTNDDISKQAKEKYVETELFEKITKYLKIDTVIKTKQKEVREYMKVMKTQKEDMEKYILSYLTDTNEDFIKIDGHGKLIKTTSKSKGSINIDNIKSSIVEGLKKDNTIKDDERILALLNSILGTIDTNRPVKTRTYIKRTTEKQKKTTEKEDADDDDEEQVEAKPRSKSKAKSKIKSTNIVNDDKSVELPKFKN